MMAGNENSGRPGGNPDIKKFSFKAKGKESNNARFNLWVSQRQSKALKEIPNDVIRHHLEELIQTYGQS
jgi:hypothetical protein